MSWHTTSIWSSSAATDLLQNWACSYCDILLAMKCDMVLVSLKLVIILIYPVFFMIISYFCNFLFCLWFRNAFFLLPFCALMSGTSAGKMSPNNPERLGVAGLALHYANIITQIDNIVSFTISFIYLVMLYSFLQTFTVFIFVEFNVILGITPHLSSPYYERYII